MTRQPVKWYEGLFLRPQHFQQQNRYYDAALYDFLRLHLPYPWGVQTLQFDHARVKQQTILLENGSFLFQDGSFCALGINAVCGGRSFKDFWHIQRERLSVYIGLRKLFDHTTNISVEDPTQPVESIPFNAKRYINKNDKFYISDYLEGGEKEPIDYLTYDLRIFFEDEVKNADDFELIKIGEIVREGMEFRITDEFYPPMLSIHAHAHLINSLKGFSESLEKTENALTQARNFLFSNNGEKAVGIKELKIITLLGLLRRSIVAINDAVGNRVTSPFQVYGLLVSLIAELSVLAPQYTREGANKEKGLSSAKKYDHGDIAATLRSHVATVGEMINDIIKEPIDVIKLKYDGVYFVGELDKKMSLKRRYVLAVDSGLDKVVVENILAPKAKISSREMMPLMIARSLTGARLVKLRSPIDEVIQKESTSYLDIVLTDDTVKAINEAGNVAVFLDKLSDDVTIEVIQLHEQQ